MRILLIEDDTAAATFLRAGLRHLAGEVAVATDGGEGLARGLGERWDMLIVDRMMPGLDGLSVVSALRDAGSRVPVLFLSALGGIDDRVAGLRAGGDDYLVKPFSLLELEARVESLARRARMAGDTVIRVEGLELDIVARSVHRDGELVELQPREYALLEYLARNAGRVVTRAMLLEAVWNFHFEPQTNLVESHISRLRGKLNKGRCELIHTVRHTGYRLGAA